MKWNVKEKTKYHSIKRKFAIAPVKINHLYFWMSHYYEYIEDGPEGAVLMARFHTWEEAARWIDTYR